MSREAAERHIPWVSLLPFDPIPCYMSLHYKLSERRDLQEGPRIPFRLLHRHFTKASYYQGYFLLLWLAVQMA
jgi:hypothetical protein